MDFELDKGFRIGGWDINPRQLSIIRDETRIRLEPKVMAVLVCLAERPGDVVTRDEFADAVWAGRVVNDEVLSRNISLLRSQLGDDVREPRFIQTIPGRGYRLIIPVEAPKGGIDSTDLSQRLWFWVVGAMLGAMVLLLVGSWLRDLFDEPATLDSRTVVVLPFKNLCGSDAYVSEGLTEDIRGALADVSVLKVIARTTTFRIKGDDAVTIGRSFGAGTSLTGSVCLEGDRLKVSARMVDTNTELLLWSQNHERTMTMADVFEIQKDISESVVKKLVGTLQIAITPVSTNDLEAYILLQRADRSLQRRGEAPIRLSIELYNEAIEKDPEFGQAFVGLAEAYIMLPDYAEVDGAPLLKFARDALARADELGAENSRLHKLLADIDRKQGRWFDAARELELGLARTPDDPEIHHGRSLLLGQLGFMAEALAAAKRAVELDPLSPVINQRFAVLSFWANDAASAAEYYQRARRNALDHDAIPEAYAAMLLQQGKFAEAIAELKDMQVNKGMPSDWVDPVVGGIRGTTDLETAVAALDRANDEGLMSQTTYIGALFILGRNGDAKSRDLASQKLIEALLRFADEGQEVQAFELVYAEGAESVRTHPMFAELLERVGLIDYWQQTERWPPACSWNRSGVVCH